MIQAATVLTRTVGVEVPHATVEQNYVFERPIALSHGDGSRSAGRIDLPFSLALPRGKWGLDLAPFVSAGTEMTCQLEDSTFFSRHFIEAGAPARPDGLDLSARSLR